MDGRALYAAALHPGGHRVQSEDQESRAVLGGWLAARPKLSVADADSCFRRKFLNEIRQRVNRLDAIVDDVYLPATLQFKIDGVLDNNRFELRNDGLNSQSISWRSLDNRHIAKST